VEKDLFMDEAEMTEIVSTSLQDRGGEKISWPRIPAADVE
jgi:hypothetical protein